MVGRQRATELCRLALGLGQADQLEAVLMSEESSLTRFATNYIHQNVAETDARLTVRAAFGQRVGTASTNRLDDEGIRAVVAQAEGIARLQRENPLWRSLPAPPIAATGAAYEDVDPATRDCQPEVRAEAVGQLVGQVKAAGLSAAGKVSTGLTEVAVANSLGAEAYMAGTRAGITAVVSGETGSGYASRTAGRFGDLDPLAIGRTAVDKALASRDPQALPPGEYTVILEPPAVADMLQYLAFLGFSALAVQEGRSFMGGKLGQQVMGDNITIWDDGHDPEGLPLPMDFEGVPRQRVTLIERGVAKGLVYDTMTAGREGRESTGHALPPGFGYGPMPLNLFMAAGEDTLEGLIAGTERGILVTRFHYTNPIHPVKAIITGMTRDGTFLIEGGKVATPVRNLRFTESILRSLSSVDGITRERQYQGGYFGGMLVPAIRVSGFTFTGATEF